MMKINFSLCQILTMNLLNVKHQGKSSNQLAFHLSVYTYLQKLLRATFQKHKKYKFTIQVNVLEKKDYVSVSKGVHKQNFATCKSFCNLQESYTDFKERHPNANFRLSKFCAQRPKWCVLADSKMTHSACVCSAHQNVVLLVDAMDGDLTCKDLTN